MFQTMLLLLLISQLGFSNGEFVCEATGFYPHEDCSQVSSEEKNYYDHNFFLSFSVAPTCGELVSSSSIALNAPKAPSSIQPLASVTGPR